MRLILTRHGETDWNMAQKIQGSHDIELNENGKNQAVQLGENLLLNQCDISKIYTSKLKRAKVTGEIVGNIIDVECEQIEGIEEINFGLWEGLNWSEVEEKFPSEYNEWKINRRYTKTPNGESYQELLERVLVAIKKIIAEATGDVLIVTHFAVIMALQCYINDTAFEDMLKDYVIKNTSTVVINSEDIR